MPTLMIQAHLAYLGALERLAASPERVRAALEEKERGDGGPVPAAVIIVGVLAGAAVVVAAIMAAVHKYAGRIK
jgi:hypothetical protein